jgi:predicted Fe-Mo cluster-binding NifX family protein
MEKIEKIKAASLPRFAVCTKTGVLADQHFGHATAFHIYEYDGGKVQKLEERPVRPYCTGREECDPDERMADILKAAEDCCCVVCMRIGPGPEKALRDKGIAVHTTYGTIETAVSQAAANAEWNRLHNKKQKIKKPPR